MTDMGQMLTQINSSVAGIRDQLEQVRIEREREQERLRGLKYMRSELYLPGQNQLGAPAAAGPTFLLDPGPVSEGYVWDLRIVAGKLSAADTVEAFVGSNANGMPVGYAASNTGTGAQLVFIILIPKSSGLIWPGEALFLQTSGAGNITQVRCAGWQAPGPMSGKLF